MDIIGETHTHTHAITGHSNSSSPWTNAPTLHPQAVCARTWDGTCTVCASRQIYNQAKKVLNKEWPTCKSLRVICAHNYQTWWNDSTLDWSLGLFDDLLQQPSLLLTH